jgi:hypothetical protein
MGSLRRVLSALVLTLAGSVPWSPTTAAQRTGGDERATPLLHGVARMSCGTPMPRTYSLATPGLRAAGSGTYAAPPQTTVVRAAELVGTLELRFGADPRRGTAEAEQPPGGTWSFAALGYCTGGRGPLQYALVTPSADGRAARYELRGPASHIQRPGIRARDEGGVVRFLGTCGRRQHVVMEIWPPTLEGAAGSAEPERYDLVGTVNCTPPAGPAAPGDSTATATPSPTS